MVSATHNGQHWHRLVKNIGWTNQNIGGKGYKSDNCMGISQLLGGNCPGSLPKIYAYDGQCNSDRSVHLIMVSATHTGQCNSLWSVQLIPVSTTHYGQCNSYRSVQLIMVSGSCSVAWAETGGWYPQSLRWPMVTSHPMFGKNPISYDEMTKKGHQEFRLEK